MMQNKLFDLEVKITAAECKAETLSGLINILNTQVLERLHEHERSNADTGAVLINTVRVYAPVLEVAADLARELSKMLNEIKIPNLSFS